MPGKETARGDHPARAAAPPLIRIAPAGGMPHLDLHELFHYRELLYFLAWRDVKVHYKQAALGVAWAVLQPLLTMIVFSIVFGRLAGLPSEGIPYPVFTFAALLPWQFFAGALTRAGTSLVSNTNLITKVYFPRLVIPCAAVLSGLVDFAVSFAVLLGLMAWYGMPLTPAILLLPLLLLLLVLAALAASLWLSALHVRYRDVQYTIPFLVQAWFFISPVAYSRKLVPAGTWEFIYGLNPLAGIIQGFRWALVGAAPPEGLVTTAVLTTLVLLAGGLYYFKRMEDSFADVI